MQAHILYFRWLEILGQVGNLELRTFLQSGELWIEIDSFREVGNLELRTFLQSGELWIEILSQGLGS